MNATSNGPVSVTMGDIAKAMWRRKLLPLLLLALGLLAGYAVNTLVKPRYETEALLIIERAANLPVDETQPAQQPLDPLTDREVADQINILKSRDLAAKVAKRLGLENQPDFAVSKPSQLSEFLINYGFIDDPRQKSREQQIIDTLMDSLTVYQLPTSNVIGIKYVSGDPAHAEKIANEFAEIFMFTAKEEQVGSAGRTREWLSKQIDDLRAKVTEGERMAEAFRAEKGLLRGERDTLTTQQVSELNSQITVAEGAKAEIDARLKEIRALMASKGAIDSSSEVLSSSAIQSLLQREQEARQRLNDLSATYLDNHPKIKAAKRDIATINAQVRREARKIMESVEGQAKIANSRVRTLKQQLAALKTEKTEDGQDDVKLREMERDIAANRTLLENLLGRFATANARQTTPMPSVARLIQRAEKPTSVLFPRPGPVFLLTSLAGLISGLGLSFMFAVSDAMSQKSRAVRTLNTAPVVNAAPVPPALPVEPRREPARHVARNLPKDRAIPSFTDAKPQPAAPVSDVVRPAEESNPTQVPATGVASGLVIEKIAEKTEPATSQEAESAGTAALSYIVSTIAEGMKPDGISSASFTRIDGEPFDAAAAAIAAARKLSAQGHKVLIIDGDHENTAVETLLGLAKGKGLSDATGDMSLFSKIIAQDPASKVHVIRFGSLNDSVSLGTVSRAMPKILSSLNDIYDAVIFHGGAANSFSPYILQHFSTAFLMSGASKRREVTLAADTLVERGVDAVHFVELPEAQASA